MAKVKDDMDIEVEDSVLAKVKDPAFQETDALLTYREQRRAKEKEVSDKKKAEEEEKNKPKKLFGLF